jgi:hypothetical protein
MKLAHSTGLNLSIRTVVTAALKTHDDMSWNELSQRAFHGPQPTLNRAARIPY